MIYTVDLRYPLKAFIHKGLKACPTNKKARLRMVILVTKTRRITWYNKMKKKQDNKPIILQECYYYQINISQINILLSV